MHKIAYFSMEIALDPVIPAYRGGLGVLAGDTLRSAADMELPIVGFIERLKGFTKNTGPIQIVYVGRPILPAWVVRT